MQYRKLGRTGWLISEIGYGMWGLADWSNTDEEEVNKSLNLAVEMGCNFFDTAWGYGSGRSEKILGALLKKYPNRKLYAATKMPPKNFVWPAKSHFSLDDTFPPDHIFEYTEKSLENLQINSIDLMQFHVWSDKWADDVRWQKAIKKLKEAGKIRAVGISINRWEPENAIKALRTGMIDVVQVVYNIFDQNPEDKLFPVCDELDIGVIARCPYDEGTLTGNLTKESSWPEGDFRRIYFGPENLIPSIKRAEALRPVIPDGMTMAQIALRFILSNKTVSTVIPGMRKTKHVRENIEISDGRGLSDDVLKKLRAHRWDRNPTSWSF